MNTYTLPIVSLPFVTAVVLTAFACATQKAPAEFAKDQGDDDVVVEAAPQKKLKRAKSKAQAAAAAAAAAEAKQSGGIVDDADVAVSAQAGAVAAASKTGAGGAGSGSAAGIPPVAQVKKQLAQIAQQRAAARKYKSVYVTVEVLNVRERPDERAPVVAKLAKGSMVPVEVSGGWAKVGEKQYVMTRFLSETKPTGARTARVASK